MSLPMQIITLKRRTDTDYTDNHIVLVDPAIKTPTLDDHECRSVTAEFTPRVRIDHPNTGRHVSGI